MTDLLTEKVAQPERLLHYSEEQLSETNQFLNLYLGNIYGFRESTVFEDKTEFVTFQIFDSSEKITPDYIARTAKQQVSKHLKNFFNTSVEHFVVTFDLGGINKLFYKLKDFPQINSKSKKFTLDLSFKVNKLDNNPTFLALEEVEERYNTISIPYISNAYFDNSKISFTLSIIEVKSRPMIDDELEKYAERFLISNGIYKVDQVVFTKEEAYRIFKNMFACTIKMKFSTTIDNKCGFIIVPKLGM